LKILAIIPARAGSKRLKGKNRLPLGKKPLLLWTIQTAQKVREITDILVSTDCPKIARTASESGVLAPWLRPKRLAGDRSSSVAVALHALDWYERHRGLVDGVLLLQPTSPFRSATNIRKAIMIFKKNHKRPVIGITPEKAHPLQSLKIKRKILRPIFGLKGLRKRHQDLGSAYRVSGAIYLVSVKHLKKERSFFGNKNQPYLMENEVEAIDIDTQFEYRVAQLLVKSQGTR